MVRYECIDIIIIASTGRVDAWTQLCSMFGQFRDSHHVTILLSLKKTTVSALKCIVWSLKLTLHLSVAVQYDFL